MAVPANITSELAFLQAQVAAAEPLQSAPRATVKAIQLNAAKLVSDLDKAVISAAGSLDTWTAPLDPGAIASGVLGLYSACVDQNTLCNMRGYIGRATSNVNQIQT